MARAGAPHAGSGPPPPPLAAALAAGAAGLPPYAGCPSPTAWRPCLPFAGCLETSVLLLRSRCQQQRRGRQQLAGGGRGGGGRGGSGSSGGARLGSSFGCQDSGWPAHAQLDSCGAQAQAGAHGAAGGAPAWACLAVGTCTGQQGRGSHVQTFFFTSWCLRSRAAIERQLRSARAQPSWRPRPTRRPTRPLLLLLPPPAAGSNRTGAEPSQSEV